VADRADSVKTFDKFGATNGQPSVREMRAIIGHVAAPEALPAREQTASLTQCAAAPQRIGVLQ
jgi:hypothetical protein